MTTAIELTLEKMLVCAYQKNFEGVLRHKARVLEMAQPRDAEPPAIPTPGTGAWAWQQMQRGPEVWVRRKKWADRCRIHLKNYAIMDELGEQMDEMDEDHRAATDWELCDAPKRVEATGPTEELSLHEKTWLGELVIQYGDAEAGHPKLKAMERLYNRVARLRLAAWTAAREGMQPQKSALDNLTYINRIGAELGQQEKEMALDAAKRVTSQLATAEARARELEKAMEQKVSRVTVKFNGDEYSAAFQPVSMEHQMLRALRAESERDSAKLRADTADLKLRPLETANRQLHKKIERLQSELAAAKEQLAEAEERPMLSRHNQELRAALTQARSDLAALRGEEWTWEWCKQTFESVAGGDLDVLAWGSYDEADQAQLVRFANACRVRPEVPKQSHSELSTDLYTKVSAAQPTDRDRANSFYRLGFTNGRASMMANTTTPLGDGPVKPPSDLPTEEDLRAVNRAWHAELAANETERLRNSTTEAFRLARRGWVKLPAEDATVQQWWDADLQDLDRDWKSLDSDERSWAHRMFVTAWSGARAGSGSDGALTLAENNELARLFTAVRDCDSADNGDTWDALCAYVASLRSAAVSAVAKERDEARAELSAVRDSLQTLVDEQISPEPTLSAQELIAIVEKQFTAQRIELAQAKAERAQHWVEVQHWRTADNAADDDRLVTQKAKERDAVQGHLDQARRLLDERGEAIDRLTAELTALRSRYSVPLTSEHREELARAIDEAFYPKQQGFPTWDTCLAADDDDELSDVGASRRADAFAALDAIAPRIARVGVRELSEAEVTQVLVEAFALNMSGRKPYDPKDEFAPYLSISLKHVARAILAKATELEWKS